jgi:hypothetical protein
MTERKSRHAKAAPDSTADARQRGWAAADRPAGKINPQRHFASVAYIGAASDRYVLTRSNCLGFSNPANHPGVAACTDGDTNPYIHS